MQCSQHTKQATYIKLSQRCANLFGTPYRQLILEWWRKPTRVTSTFCYFHWKYLSALLQERQAVCP